MIRVLHIITGLDLGGAEMVLLRLLEHTDRKMFDPRVVSLRARGPLTERIEALGISVTSLGFSGVPSLLIVAPRLWKEVRRQNPNVVQTWMYHGDLIGGPIARAAGFDSVAWGLHAGPLPPDRGTWMMRAGLKVGARMSRRVPAAIVCCSMETRKVHASLGYDAAKMLVIQNGFDIPDVPEDSPASVRKEMGLPADARLIGRVGRFHPQKDHENFLDALTLLTVDGPWAVVMVGLGLENSNETLVRDIADRGLAGKIHLLGPRDDVARLHAAFDVAVSSSSYGEGLPIVLGEAIAAGTIVVTTDVGDSADLVSDPERIVAPRDSRALADAIQLVLSMDPMNIQKLAMQEKEKLVSRYGLDAMARAYANLHQRLMTP